MLLLAALAFADDGVWVGGAVSALGGYTINEQEPLSALLQAEGDLNITQGIFSADIDLDVHIDPLGDGFLAPDDKIVWCPDTGYVLTCPRPVEEVELTLADESWRVSAGLLNPAIGLEYWDEWQNPLPTFSLAFALQPSQIAGGEVAWTFGEDGPTVSVFGGGDWGWYGDDGMPTLDVGATVSAEGDVVSTYNGVWAMPLIDNYGALLCTDIAASEAVRVGVSVSPGLTGGNVYVGGRAELGLFPEGPLTPTLRVEGTFDPNGAVTGPDAPWGAASLGANWTPVEFLTVQLAGRVTLEGQAVNPGVRAGVTLFRPEPE